MADEQNLSRTERRRLAREELKLGGGSASRWLGRRLALWGGLVAVLVLIVWGMVVAATRPVTPAAGQTLLDPVTAADWLRGPAVVDGEAASSSVATLVEYSDFQCPACSYFAPVVKQLVEDFPDRLRLVYRHYPLRSIHPNAQISAQAAEAAGRQGKFWEMSDLLFAKQEEWSTSQEADKLFNQYAVSLGINPTQFASDLDSPLVKAEVDQDFASATRHGLLGTPTFFLNGVQIENPRSYDEFYQLVSEGLINAQ